MNICSSSYSNSKVKNFAEHVNDNHKLLLQLVLLLFIITIYIYIYIYIIMIISSL